MRRLKTSKINIDYKTTRGQRNWQNLKKILNVLKFSGLNKKKTKEQHILINDLSCGQMTYDEED